MTVHERIESKLREALAPIALEVVNESSMHNVPKGSETHFKVFVASPAFDGLGLLARHRRVNEVLKEELANGVHALSIRARTPAELAEEQPAFESPKCLGGNGK